MTKTKVFFKDDFIDFMQKKYKELTKVKANELIDIFTGSVEDALSKGKEVKLVGFGTFGINKIPARKGRNPQDGKSMDILAHHQVKFRAGERLKTACRKNKVK